MSSASQLPLTLRPEQPSDGAAIERLHERAFGPGRFARTAFRLREDGEADPTLSFVAFVATLLVGSVRLTPVRLAPVFPPATGPASPGSAAVDANGRIVVLGPLTVEPAFEGRGIGSALIKASLDAARLRGVTLVFLVGDEPFYQRFGFRRVGRATIAMPGPVDPARFLVAELAPHAMTGVSGILAPAD